MTSKNTQYSPPRTLPEIFEGAAGIPSQGDFSVGRDKYELEIWEEFRNGNESSFILMYKLYFNRLITYGGQFTRDRDIIKDAVQDLFIDLRKKRSKLSSLRYSLKYYLFKSLKNNILQYIRKDKILAKHHYNFSADRLTTVDSMEARIIQTQEYSDLTRRLKLAQGKLTNRQREALFYLYYENLSYTEIQKLMDLKSIKSARNLAYGAVKSLRESMIK